MRPGCIPGLPQDQHRRVLTRLLKAQDTEGIKVLLALDVMDTDAFAEGAALAAKADNAEAAALLADAEHKSVPLRPKRRGMI